LLEGTEKVPLKQKGIISHKSEGIIPFLLYNYSINLK